jgi:hypothetical protein
VNLQNEIRKIIREAEKRGWVFKGGGHNHFKGVHSVTHKTVTISSSPSSQRAVRSTLSYLRQGERP